MLCHVYIKRKHGRATEPRISHHSSPLRPSQQREWMGGGARAGRLSPAESCNAADPVFTDLTALTADCCRACIRSVCMQHAWNLRLHAWNQAAAVSLPTPTSMPFSLPIRYASQPVMKPIAVSGVTLMIIVQYFSAVSAGTAHGTSLSALPHVCRQAGNG